MLRWKKPDIRSVLFEERLIGYLDPGAERYLAPLNEPPKLYTTSSCTGRIAIVEGRFHWLRDDARIVFKSHDPITVHDVERVLKRPFSDLWLKATGPILHLRAYSLECALELLDAARQSGFKHSGLISAGETGYTVEVMSSIQLNAPLRLGGVDMLARESLDRLVELSNRALEEGRRRLEQLARAAEKLRSCW